MRWFGSYLCDPVDIFELSFSVHLQLLLLLHCSYASGFTIFIDM